ncbi:MAG: SPOR domain-containing protein [candidate division KSB1 bacterium]|nr:SPOR domain-containing protein [candidate division KSB1 bacterium]MDZ7338014.1 SPOR domain-containing protein [candidate division KSB1 bacterium]MDZ7386042.1 SPOR domain-containing protein [candidate division KSB1 bacterium]
MRFSCRCLGLGGALFLAVLVVGCAARRQVTEQGAPGKNAGIVEDWDPGSLGESEPVIPMPDRSSRIGGQVPSVGVDTVAQPSSVLGYRVQIVSTPFEEVAREVRKEALLKFEEPVYMVFDAPYYKVRVGDCISRFEAEELQQKAMEKGFGQAWVVRTLVSASPPRERP